MDKATPTLSPASVDSAHTVAALKSRADALAARVAALTPEQRSEIAKKAAASRWKAQS